MKKISIIIPVYNAENYVGRCLDSIKRQTYKDFEIILIDDQSTDNTLSFLNNYRKNNPELDISISSTSKNSGPSVSRNLGIEKASGKYIFFIDADDDLATDSALKEFISKTENNPDIVIGETCFYVNGSLAESNYHKLQNKKEVYIGSEILDGFFDTEWASTVWNKLYSLDFINKNNLRFPDGLLHEDELWVFQFSALATKVNFVNIKTYNYYFSNQGSITANVGLKNLRDYKAILREQLKFSKEEHLFAKNQRTEGFLRNFAKKILLAKLATMDYNTFRTFYLELKNDFATYFPKKDEFALPPFLAFHLYKMKFDESFVLYGKLPKYVNRLIKL